MARDGRKAEARSSGEAGKVLGQQERVQIFFTLIGIPAQKMVIYKCCGGRAYSVLRNLVAPANPMDNRDRSETY